jgi:thiol-disulfide isomerase/thioredoxin
MDIPWRTPAGLHPHAARLPVLGELPSLAGATGWLNTPPLDPAGLRGRVVLVSFWTYTCINWRRQLPYLRAWAEKYAGHGLTVIGVHTPEFGFEHDAGLVRWAVGDMKVEYPVAVDSDYGIWTAFGNHYWPALYFADASGQLRHSYFGEGEYAQSEMVIQQLLADAGQTGASLGLVSPGGRGLEAPPDWSSLRSPESYTGYERAGNFTSPGGLVPGRAHRYTAPGQLGRNDWALSGSWTATGSAVTAAEAGGQLSFRFHARDVHLVMSPGGQPASGGEAGGGAAGAADSRFRVRLDGQQPGAAHGTDIDAQGHGTLTEPRLYQLIRQRGPVVDRTIEITFEFPGAQAYCFTFG